MNGMETGLVLVGFALAMMLLVRLDTTTRRGAAALGASLALMTLARLDHGLLAVGVLVPVAVGMRRSRSALLAGAASFSLPITTYLAANKLVFGHALPVSGRLKSTFPEISTSFFDAVGRVAGGALPTFWLPWAVRLSLIIIPCVLALVWLATEAVRKDKTPFDRALTGASLGALGLAAYDILFVPLQHQGHWYFPVNTLVASLVVVRLPDALGARVSASAAFRSVLQATCFVVVCGTFAFQRTPHNLHLAEFYHDVAPALRQHYEVPPRLVSYDDGIVAYATGFPTLSGLGFTLDGEAVDAASEGRLLELAWDRGYRHVTSLVYFPPWFMGPAVEKNIDAITSAWPVGRGGEAPPFSFSIDYRTDDGEFVIFRIASLPDPG
jgi:hypothetical protein